MDAQHGSLLGMTYTDDQIEAFLKTANATYERLDDDATLCHHVAEAIGPRHRHAQPGLGRNRGGAARHRPSRKSKSWLPSWAAADHASVAMAKAASQVDMKSWLRRMRSPFLVERRQGDRRAGRAAQLQLRVHGVSYRSLCRNGL